ncbi:acid sphingomyelinase-like phosphodiesterase 3b [Ruditapes philippinarum]|uniref:acid sphingomyelinase-like phosphodiesterase 3b n=1 Tax=Ruditapes philippinarum TaxID=129788 RepID=UPI00295B41A2|nr:acid sphingomyelinase-like phosphodiesterase 3b [Ruditapes philippinarum]
MLNKLCIFLVCASVAAEDVGYFWHVTDFHWDFSYWTDQLSCNGMNISQPGLFGNQWCDSPWRLVQETISGIKHIKGDVDFMLWTGDTVPHVDNTHLSIALNEELVRNVTELMKNEFPNTPIYATFGNHDYYPNNMYPPHGNEIYNDNYNLWKVWINDTSQDKNFLKGGYYTVLARPGLRIVALNTNMYYTHDTVSMGIDDPADQLLWLENVLENAEKQNEKVILTGHVPPGISAPRGVRWMYESFNKKMNGIVVRHADVIVAMHFGHEHHDNFRIYYGATGPAKVCLFIAPSVTPWRFQILSLKETPHNPGVRLIKYDRQTGKQLDIYQYYMDLNAANTIGYVNWTLGYQATVFYNIPDITAPSMEALATKMRNANSQEFRSYVNWYNTNGAKDFSCDARCHKSVMCGLGNLELSTYSACLKSQNVFNCSPGNCPIVG